jgi:hypothetical protein
MPEIPRRYSLKEAAQLISADGWITAKSVRTMVQQGKLRLHLVAGTDSVTAEHPSRLCWPPTKFPWSNGYAAFAQGIATIAPQAMRPLLRRLLAPPQSSAGQRNM